MHREEVGLNGPTITFRCERNQHVADLVEIQRVGCKDKTTPQRSTCEDARQAEVQHNSCRNGESPVLSDGQGKQRDRSDG